MLLTKLGTERESFLELFLFGAIDLQIYCRSFLLVLSTNEGFTPPRVILYRLTIYLSEKMKSSSFSYRCRLLYNVKVTRHINVI